MSEQEPRQLFAHLTLETLKEQRAKRRWGIFFKLTFLFYFTFLLVLFFRPERQLLIEDHASNQYHTAVVNVQGVIASGKKANAGSLNRSLRKAFKNPKVKGVLLRINSPGGSPVQSDDVFKQIMTLRHEHPKTKIYAVCEDVCASGAYYIASAADKIFANPASRVGSIGC